MKRLSWQVLEMFGAGTACVICPIEHILYMDQDLFIPTMENGPEVAGRLYRELTDIQVSWKKKVINKF